MPELAEPFVVLRGALDEGDIAFLRQACKARLNADSIPCFAMIDLNFRNIKAKSQ